MTDIEQKALALISDVRREYPNAADYTASHIALCRAIEQHEAFKQEVSDAVEACKNGGVNEWRNLNQFIIPKPKPDPLEDVIAGWTGGTVLLASDLRAALEARGLEIREKGQ
jgi:hypothetical protein